MSEEIRKMINKIKSFKNIITENITSNKYLYVTNYNKEVIMFNIPSDDRELLNKYLYDENGKIIGGYGPQVDDESNYLKFDSLEDAQRWNDERDKIFLLKKTKNKKYSDLSNIAHQLRITKDIDFQNINRGSCFKFAKEISKLGYNKFTFVFSEEEQENIHVYIKLSANLYFDAEGFHKKNEIKSDYEIGGGNIIYDADMDELDSYCNIDTYQSLTTIPISNEVWKKIKNIIDSNKIKF